MVIGAWPAHTPCHQPGSPREVIVYRTLLICIVLICIAVGVARFVTVARDLPCLCVAGYALIPMPVIPPQAAAHGLGTLPTISIERLKCVPLETPSGVEATSITSGSSLELDILGTTTRLEALDCLPFWDDPRVREVTDYRPIVTSSRCERIVDGDTIVLSGGLRVRYIGIDAPETKHPDMPVEPFGRQAAERNRQLVAGKRVRLEYDEERADQYGRTLAYVHVDGRFINAELVAGGYAEAKRYGDNLRYAELFDYLELRAKEAGSGIWGPVSREMPTTSSR